MRSGNLRPVQVRASSCISLCPVIGVSAVSRPKIKTLVGGTPTAERVSISKSMAWRASGGRMTKASTFFLDFPALITISILQHVTILAECEITTLFQCYIGGKNMPISSSIIAQNTAQTKLTRLI